MHSIRDMERMAAQHDARSALAAATKPRFGDWIQVYSGRQFWPMDPRPEEIHIEDVAHGLAMTCRYTGHCERFYSVAEHATLMARWFMEDRSASVLHAAWALHHDDSEAYITDVARPVKPFLTGYKAAEDRLMAAVALRFGLPTDMPAAVHEADTRILMDEMRQNMKKPPVPWSIDAEPLGVTLRFWSPEQAEREYLSTHYALLGGR